MRGGDDSRGSRAETPSASLQPSAFSAFCNSYPSHRPCALPNATRASPRSPLLLAQSVWPSPNAWPLGLRDAPAVTPLCQRSWRLRVDTNHPIRQGLAGDELGRQSPSVNAKQAIRNGNPNEKTKRDDLSARPVAMAVSGTAVALPVPAGRNQTGELWAPRFLCRSAKDFVHKGLSTITRVNWHFQWHALRCTALSRPCADHPMRTGAFAAHTRRPWHVSTAPAHRPSSAGHRRAWRHEAVPHRLVARPSDATHGWAAAARAPRQPPPPSATAAPQPLLPTQSAGGQSPPQSERAT